MDGSNEECADTPDKAGAISNESDVVDLDPEIESALNAWFERIENEPVPQHLVDLVLNFSPMEKAA